MNLAARRERRVLLGASDVSATVTKGDAIRIVPEKGPERVMLVAHVEHYVITLADLPENGEGNATADQ